MRRRGGERIENSCKTFHSCHKNKEISKHIIPSEKTITPSSPHVDMCI